MTLQFESGWCCLREVEVVDAADVYLYADGAGATGVSPKTASTFGSGYLSKDSLRRASYCRCSSWFDDCSR